MKSITPPYLKPGDRVGLVSTARKVDEGELAFAIKQIKKWNLEPVLGNTIGSEDNQFAGDDWTRARDFRQMLENDKIQAVFCVRGGYGTLRILDKIDFGKFKKKPKWVVGFSDVTGLLTHIHTQFDIETILGPMPANFQKTSKDALESLHDALFGKKLEYKVKGSKLNITGKASGQIVGGNLSVLMSIASSRSDLKTKGKILFLEDVDEYLYHIDRMMVYLKRSYKLKGLSGIILGGFSKMRDNEIPFGKDAYEIISEHVKNYGYPVAFDFPAGHVDDNRALIIGREADLNVADSGVTLKFKS